MGVYLVCKCTQRNGGFNGSNPIIFCLLPAQLWHFQLDQIITQTLVHLRLQLLLAHLLSPKRTSGLQPESLACTAVLASLGNKDGVLLKWRQRILQTLEKDSFLQDLIRTPQLSDLPRLHLQL